MTAFDKVVNGLRIIQSYLSSANCGGFCAEHDEIFVHGVHRDVLGGDDRALLEAMNWLWDDGLACWKKYV